MLHRDDRGVAFATIGGAALAPAAGRQFAGRMAARPLTLTPPLITQFNMFFFVCICNALPTKPPPETLRCRRPAMALSIARAAKGAATHHSVVVSGAVASARALAHVCDAVPTGGIARALGIVYKLFAYIIAYTHTRA